MKVAEPESTWRTTGLIAHTDRQSHRKYSTYQLSALIVHTETLAALATLGNWLLVVDTLEHKQLYEQNNVEKKCKPYWSSQSHSIIYLTYQDSLTDLLLPTHIALAPCKHHQWSIECHALECFGIRVSSFPVKLLIMLLKSKTIDLQAVSCYPFLQVSELLPCRCTRLIHNCHVLEAALVEVFVNLAFKSDRQVHSVPPFRESTEDLASEASVAEEIPHLKTEAPQSQPMQQFPREPD